MSHLSISVFVVFLYIAGCGSGEVPVERNQQPPEDVDAAGFDASGGNEATEAFQSVLAGTCEKSFDCCSISTARALAGVSDRAECETGALQGFSAATVQGVTQAELAGTIEVDPTAAQLCRMALLDADCDAWTTTEPLSLDLPGCAEVITPQLNANDSCEADYECISGRCVERSSDGATVCATLVDDGQPCDPGDGVLCKSGSFCDNLDAKACVALTEDGRTCVGNFECASQRCEPGSAGVNVCTPRGSVCE